MREKFNFGEEGEDGRMQRRIGELRGVILGGGKKAQEATSVLFREFGDRVRGAVIELLRQSKQISRKTRKK